MSAATGAHPRSGPGTFPPWRLALAVSVAPTAFAAVAGTSDLAALFARLAEIGYDGVELAVRDPATLDAARLGGMLGDAGLQPVAIGTGQAFVDDGLSLSDARAQVRQAAAARLRGHIELAEALGCPYVIIGLVRGRTPPAASRAEALARLQEELRSLADHAGRRSVRLLIEAINRYETDLVNTLDEAAELAESVPGAGLLADTFHMNIEEAHPESAIVRHASRIAHVHLADSNRLPPGRGHFPFATLLGVLEAVGYRGWLSVEALPVPDPLGAARQAFAYLAALGAGPRRGGEQPALGPRPARESHPAENSMRAQMEGTAP